MHDIESSRDELVDELLGDSNEFEPAGEFDLEFSGAEESEVDLAAELLEVSGDEELDQFLGKVLKGASGFLRSPTGRLLKGALRKVARKALPMAGAALGNLVAPGLGGVIGGKLAGSLGSALGLEAEGLSQDELEMEVARRVVRTARQAGSTLARNPGVATNPQAAVTSAVVSAVQRNLPGLLNADAVAVASGAPASRRRSGRWYRRGGRIVLVGA